MPVSGIMYGMAVFFLAMTIIWAVFVDVVLLDQIIKDIALFLLMGVIIPIVWFAVFLFTIKCTFLNYHELTDKELIISVPPRKVRVPLEDITEIETDTTNIKTDFGTANLEMKVEDSPLEKEHYWGKFKTFGVRVQHFGNETIIQSVFSDKNLIRIKAKTKDIITNVPDVKEFITETMKAMQSRKSSLNQK